MCVRESSFQEEADSLEMTDGIKRESSYPRSEHGAVVEHLICMQKFPGSLFGIYCLKDQISGMKKKPST